MNREGVPNRSGWIWLLPVALLLAAALFRLGAREPLVPVSYSRFRQEVTSGNVESVTAKGERLEGKLKEPISIPEVQKPVQSFSTYYPRFGDEELMKLLADHGVKLSVEPDTGSGWQVLLVGLAPFLLILLVVWFVSRGIRSAGRGLFSMGKSRAKLHDQRMEKTTFDDVAGSEEAKGELVEIVDFLRDPDGVARVGGEMPKGVLLVGPPGTGKTLLARAVAGEAKVPFFTISGSDFMELFVGVGASRVRDLFREAKASAPAIVFIDELDSVGRRRGSGVGGGHDEREQTLNQLLSEMDGFVPNQGVVLIAATNRPDVLDPALLRPGRFDRKVTVSLPTLAERTAILRVHARAKPIAPDVDLETVARSTPGFSGADLKNLLNEAALWVARVSRLREAGESILITADAIEHARDKVTLGLERRSFAISDEDRKLLAHHEAGHAIVAATLPEADPLHKVTIVPRSRTMGHTEQIPRMERYLYHQDYLVDRLAVLLGGRVAEELFLDTATSGAESDLKEATHLARRMVLDWGMGRERFASVALGGEEQDIFLGRDLARRRDYSEATASEIDEEVRVILTEAHGRAREILEGHRSVMKRLVSELLEREVVQGDEVVQWVRACRSEPSSVLAQ